MSNIVKKTNGAIKVLSSKDESICKVINKFNQLRSFRLDEIEILEWKDSLNRLLGERLDLLALDFAIDQMIIGKIEYDKGLGIQNLFNALQQVEKVGDRYRIKNSMTW